jgi:hypothetical protein
LTTDKVFREFAQMEMEQTIVSSKARIPSNNVFEDVPDNAAATLKSFFRDDYAKGVTPAEPPPGPKGELFVASCFRLAAPRCLSVDTNARLCARADISSDPLLQLLDEKLDQLEAALIPDAVRVSSPSLLP